MVKYILRRAGQAVVVVFGVVTVIFIVVRLVPGDPAGMLLGPSATPDEVAGLRERLGLDQPLALQYLHYLLDAGRLDFGTSYVTGQPATAAVAQRLGATVYLAFAALLNTLVVSIPLGVVAARRAGHLADRFISSGSLALQAMPNFWIGIVLILLLARAVHLFPPAGNTQPLSVVLPAITLALPFIGIVVRLLRGSLLETMAQGFIQTARAKGLRERRVFYTHAMRNSLIPVVTIAGLELGALLGGGVVVEAVFAWPGIGRLLVTSIDARDFAVVQAAVAFMAVAFVIANLLVDILYAYLDPRIRLEARA
jgi:ABC-type dipeptide/oligopeptide/nickel transport system permease component